MGDRPIIFSAPMIAALLAGRKTQTRRIIHEGDVYEDIASELAEDFELRGWTGFWRGDALCSARLRYAAGDRLYVREAWAPLDALTHNDPGTRALAEKGFYRADGGTVDGEIARWRPSIHMPRWASRLTLLVTEVRVQRLQEISEADAVAEGIAPQPGHPGRWTAGDGRSSPSATAAFKALWGDLHGLDAWDQNPWVAAISFEVIRANIDATPLPSPAQERSEP